MKKPEVKYRSLVLQSLRFYFVVDSKIYTDMKLLSITRAGVKFSWRETRLTDSGTYHLFVD